MQNEFSYLNLFNQEKWRCDMIWPQRIGISPGPGELGMYKDANKIRCKCVGKPTGRLIDWLSTILMEDIVYPTE
jgi:ribonucleotide monophosphatase NagD (HAD superfamily)